MQTIKSIVEKYTKEIQGAVAQEAKRLVAKHLSAGLPPSMRGIKLPTTKKTKPAPKRLNGAKVMAKVAAKSMASKPAKRARRTASDLADDQSKIRAYIASNPGQRAEVIKAALKMTKRDWLLPITQLVKAGAVKTKGQKRATEYFAA